MGDFLKTYRALTEKAAPTEALQAVKNFEAWAKLQLEQKGIAKSERQRLAQLFMKELRATEKLGAKQTIKQLLSIRGIAVLRSIGEDMALSDILATASFSSTAVGSQVLSLLCSQEPRNEVEARALIKLLARFTAQSGLESPLGRLAAQNRSLLFESIKDWRRLGAKRKSATKTLERNQTPEHNQRIVRALLKMIARAQKVLKSSAAIDCDGDKNGEYGTLQELAGRRVLRLALGKEALGSADQVLLSPPKIASDLFKADARGWIHSYGYYFRLYLPGRDGQALAEPPPGARFPAIDPDLAEQYWCCFAWPMSHGSSSGACYYIDQTGILFRSDDPCLANQGKLMAPAPWAAQDIYTEADLSMGQKNKVRTNDCCRIGKDGRIWTRIY